jgi:hypothetical protein
MIEVYPSKFPNHSRVGTIVEQVSCRAVSERVRLDSLCARLVWTIYDGSIINVTLNLIRTSENASGKFVAQLGCVQLPHVEQTSPKVLRQ